MKNLFITILALFSLSVSANSLNCKILVEGTSEREVHDSAFVVDDIIDFGDNTHYNGAATEFEHSIGGVISYKVVLMRENRFWLTLTDAKGVSVSTIATIEENSQQLTLGYPDGSYPNRVPVTAKIIDEGKQVFFTDVFGYDLQCKKM